MAVGYSVRLKVFDRESETPTAIEYIAKVVSVWAGVDEFTVAGRHEGKWTDSNVRVGVVRDNTDKLSAWRLSLKRPDDHDQTLEWNVDVIIVSGESTDVEIQVTPRRKGSLVISTTKTPKPPRFISQLVDDTNLRVVNGVTVPQRDPVSVSKEDTESFARFVMSESRTIPIMGITGNRVDIDVAGLLSSQIGNLFVAHITGSASWELEKFLPKGFNVYGGAVRLWWPKMSGSRRFDHPLWTPEDSARLIEREVLSQIETATLVLPSFRSRFVRAENDVLRVRSQKRIEEWRETTRKEQARLNSRLESVGISIASLDSGAKSDDVLIDVIQTQKGIIQSQYDSIQAQIAQVEDLEARTVTAEELVELANEAVEYYADEAKMAASQVRELTHTNRALKMHLENKGIDSNDVDLNDLDEGLKNEIDKQVQELVEGMVSPQVREYSFGESFGESLDSQGSKMRARIVRVCSFLIVNDKSLAAQLEDHPLRSSSGGGVAAKKRAQDGAAARRCAIERNTSQALRLHYWELKSGAIEFASVNNHDDLTIPD